MVGKNWSAQEEVAKASCAWRRGGLSLKNRKVSEEESCVTSQVLEFPIELNSDSPWVRAGQAQHHPVCSS